MERELVLAAQQGDETAFARLIAAEAPRIYRAVLAVVRSPEDAQEVIQDASIRAWRQLGGLRDADSWPAWYRRIAMRQAIDRANRQARKRLHEIDLDSVADSTGGDPTSGWADRQAVMDALGQLATEDRVLLGLRFGADLAVADVAAALDVPLGTAKSRLHRALGRLAAAMGDGNDD